ncbi:MAG TPA: di-heme oxidoredictase family protein [Candidatus Angelobacter sp.]|nr:di-heme oxidoredictase family protein [Candidatus Angelobacter sp.]
MNSMAQTAPPPAPTTDGGVPETTVTDGDTMIVTDVNGVESSSADTTTLSPGSTTVSPTSLSANPAPATTSTSSTTRTSSATISPGSGGTPTSSLSCSLKGAKDPGPRPAGTGGFTLKGSTFSSTSTPPPRLLTTGVHDVAQPPDALGNEGAGEVLGNAGPLSTPFWFDALAVFSQLASVDGAIDSASKNPTILGLGPAFNANSCFTCHSQPTIGGTSPAQNPQLPLAHAFGATNAEDLGRFLKPNGPVREARFIFDPNDTTGNTLDGGVHELFSIQGRSDAPPNCQLLQPDFNTQINNHNAVFRIPIPVFGEGLIEGVTDSDLINNLSNFASDKSSSHIAGRFNRNGNDGTITRFGWKAQNKSMYLFSGEAANVELGVTNEVFQNEKVPGLGCATNGLPEDNTHVLAANPPGNDPASTTSLVSSAVENFALFMRLNGAPGQCAFNSTVDSSGAAVCISLTDTSTSAQAAISQQIARGKQLFGTPSNGGVGCVLCHSATLTSGTSNITGLNNRQFAPFSDFALHHMGATLADGVNQGVAGSDEFRTAPLWGIGQRLFFLHDGRATNLLQAIQAHFSDPNVCFKTSSSESFTVNGHSFTPATSGQSCGSEANDVVRSFNALCASDKNAVLEYLRSL